MDSYFVCSLTDHPSELTCNGTIYYVHQNSQSDDVKPSQSLFWIYLVIYICLVLFAGLMSGLTMGLLSLDIMSLEVFKRGGKPKEQKYANRIIHLVKQHHLLLVTLLLANAIAVESMPILLDKVTHEIVAIAISVISVLIFVKILPQSLCSRYGLAFDYYCAPLVHLVMATFFSVAFPISKFLDSLFGKDHSTFFRRAELKELVEMHRDKDKENVDPLTYDEVLIVKSALDMRDKTVIDAMTPLESVFMLNIDDKIGHINLKEITSKGHSRIPIFRGSRQDVVGILLVKKLIALDPNDNISISEIEGTLLPPPSCSTITPLYDILHKFQTGRSHLYLVYDESDNEIELVGIITLEDVIEELIGKEILDETDGGYTDVQRRISVARARVNIFRRYSVSMEGVSRPQRGRRRNLRSQSQPGHVVRSQLEHLKNPTLPVLPTIPSSVPEHKTLLSSDDDNAPLLINADIHYYDNDDGVFYP